MNKCNLYKFEIYVVANVALNYIYCYFRYIMTLNERGAGNGKLRLEIELSEYITSEEGRLQNVVFK